MTGFSLIMGTIERTEELESPLSSLAAQTHQDLELIVVDQNPDERLAPVLDRYKRQFPILHLRCEKGLSRAKNLGLQHASREIVGFPDDNCWYPSDLLQRVAEFFVENPPMDGLCGRSADQSGNDTNGRFDTGLGLIDKLNVWRRAIAYNVFLRRDTAREATFDERLGPGAGTPWAAGDETDYLLRLLRRGARLYYDPGLAAVHPAPVPPYNSGAKRRAYAYGRGMGKVMAKHGYPLPFKVKWLIRPLGEALLYAGAFHYPGAGYHLSTFRGRLRGMLPRSNGTEGTSGFQTLERVMDQER